MECAICFLDCKLFKVLECGHYFCVQCVKDLWEAPVALASEQGNAPSKPSHSKSNGPIADDEKKSVPVQGSEHGRTTKSTSFNGNFPEHGRKETGLGIPCPQCRRLTPKNYILKNKYVCKLVCRSCDEEKLADEFRWCFDCEQSTCSRCFVDKHVASDPGTSTIYMHKGCKWSDDFPQAVYCVKRLIHELKQADQIIEINQKYTKKYLEDLHEYLCVDIEQRVKASQETKQRLVTDLCNAFNINETRLSSANIVEDGSSKSYGTLLDELIKISDIQLNKNPQLSDELLKLKCLPYKQLAELLIEGDKKLSHEISDVKPNIKLTPPVNNELKFDFKSTTVVHHPQMSNPNDFCYIPEHDVVLIIDYNSGLFVADPITFTCQRIEGKLQGSHWCRINTVPKTLFGCENVVAINTLIKDKDWKVTFVDVKPIIPAYHKHKEINITGQLKKFIVGENLHFQMAFPDKKNAITASSQLGFYCSTNKNIYHLNDKKEWDEPIYSTTGPDGDGFGRLCPIVQDCGIDNVQIYIFNRSIKKLTALLYNEMTRQVLSTCQIGIVSEGPFDKNLTIPLATSASSPLLLANQHSSKLMMWSANEAHHSCSASTFGCFQILYDFTSKHVQKVLRSTSFLWFIFSVDKSNARQAEFCKIYS